MCGEISLGFSRFLDCACSQPLIFQGLSSVSVPKFAWAFRVAFVDVSENAQARGQKKKGKKREVAGAMWGLEKGKRNDAVD